MDFACRTEVLAEQAGVRIGDLPKRLKISRASLFGYRTGKLPITSKAWRKLEHAERDAGISQPLADQLRAATPERATELLGSASLDEILPLLPESTRRRVLDSFVDTQLYGMNWRMIGFFLNAEALADLIKSKGPAKEISYFVKAVAADVSSCRQLWDTMVASMCEALGINPPSGPKQPQSKGKAFTPATTKRRQQSSDS